MHQLEREESPFYSNCRAIFNDNFIWHNRDDYDVDIMKGVIDSWWHYLFVIENRFSRCLELGVRRLGKKKCFGCKSNKIFPPAPPPLHQTRRPKLWQFNSIQSHEIKKKYDIIFSSVGTNIILMHRNVVNFRLLQIGIVSDNWMNFQLHR